MNLEWFIIDFAVICQENRLDLSSQRDSLKGPYLKWACCRFFWWCMMLGRAMDFARPQGKCHVEKVLLVYNTTSYTIHLHTSRSARFLKLGISLPGLAQKSHLACDCNETSFLTHPRLLNSRFHLWIHIPSLFGDPEDTANNVSQQKYLPSFGSVLATTRHKKKFIQVLSRFQEHAWSTDLIADAPLWCDAQVVNDSLPFDMRQGLSHGTFEARKTDFFSRNQVSLQQLWVCFILIEATFHNLKNMFGDMNHESKDEHQGRCNFTCT